MFTPIIVVSLLLAPSLLGFLIYRQAFTLQARLLGLSLCFFFFGVGHFAQTDGMIAMLPDIIPARRELIWLTGLAEWLVAVCLLFSRWRVIALIAAFTMLIVFFPSNIWAAWQQTGLGGHQWGLVYLWIRAPLQALLIGWCMWSLQSLRAKKRFTL